VRACLGGLERGERLADAALADRSGTATAGMPPEPSPGKTPA
jgi:hypothetical protein